MEQVADVVDEHCSFPTPEKEKLFRRSVVAFLVGNENMHAKDFSLITDTSRTTATKVVRLSPAYDFVNSTIVQPNGREEFALALSLSLAGQKSDLRREHLVDYYGLERLGLTEAAVKHVLSEISGAFGEWERLVAWSFLTESMKQRYRSVLDQRVRVMGL